MIPLLVCDDSNMARKQLIRALPPEWPVSLSQANNGEEALGLYRARPASYDLVLMDCETPEMDGYAATEAIRQLERERGIPPGVIVALTAHVLDHIKQECFAAGMDGHLSKPFDVAQLDKVLRQFSAIRPG